MKEIAVYIIAKVFDRQGCLAYRTKSINEARNLPGTLEAIREDGVQIVVLGNPETYPEYAPYTFVDNIKDFIERVGQLKAA